MHCSLKSCLHFILWCVCCNCYVYCVMFQVRRIPVFQIVFRSKKQFFKKLTRESSRWIIYQCSDVILQWNALHRLHLLSLFLEYLFRQFLYVFARHESIILNVKCINRNIFQKAACGSSSCPIFTLQNLSLRQSILQLHFQLTVVIIILQSYVG